GLLDLAGSDTEVKFPLYTQHWCDCTVIQVVIHEGIPDAVTIRRLGHTAEYPKEDHGIVVSFGGIDQLLERFHALTCLRKFRAHLAGVSDILLQRPGLAYLGLKHLVGKLNRLRGVQIEQSAQASQRQLFPLTNIIELLLQLPLKSLQLER